MAEDRALTENERMALTEFLESMGQSVQMVANELLGRLGLPDVQTIADWKAGYPPPPPKPKPRPPVSDICVRPSRKFRIAD